MAADVPAAILVRGPMLVRNMTITAAVAAGIAATMVLRRRTPIRFRSQIAFITGGSRGLGLLLARELASRGAQVAIAARDAEELARAEKQIRSEGGEVLTLAGGGGK